MRSAGRRTSESRDHVIAVVNRSNQRGGRMLSLVDLLEADTLTLGLAGFLVERIEAGASWLVGARPGGAGKTTVMGALLAMLPDGVPVHLSTSGGHWRAAEPGECIVGYELSPGFYDAYVWGEDVAALTRRGLAGCRIVSNLHADTVAEAREQIVDQCGATEAGFRSFSIFLPIAIGSGLGRNTRRITECWLATTSGWERWNGAVSKRGTQICSFLEGCMDRGVRRIEDLRREWLATKQSDGV